MNKEEDRLSWNGIGRRRLGGLGERERAWLILEGRRGGVIRRLLRGRGGGRGREGGRGLL